MTATASPARPGSATLGLARLGPAQNYDMSLTAIQKHVAVLEGAGLLTRRRRGRESLARGEARTIRSASQLLTELEALWRERIARIDTLIENSPPPKE